MAKNLPYFKFICSEWNDGDITLCSMEAQGLFINLCSLYWSKEGELSYSKTKRRFIFLSDLPGQPDPWDELINENIIEVEKDFIIVRFLDEQLKDRDILSDKNRANALKRWEKMHPESEKDATVLRPLTIKRRKEERREEKKREEENELIIWPTFDDFWNTYDKKSGNKIDSLKKWDKIDQKLKEAIMTHVFAYVRSTPDPQFRKNPETYLNQKHYHNEILTNQENGRGHNIETAKKYATIISGQRD